MAGHLQVSLARVLMRIERSSVDASAWVSPGAALIFPSLPKAQVRGHCPWGLACSRFAHEPGLLLDEAPFRLAAAPV